jgi:hypothetical protein
MIRRCDITCEEVETQEAFESRVALIKSFLLKLVDLIVHRRIISANLLGEFLDNKVIYNDYPELLEQLLEEDGDLIEDNEADQEL